MKIKAYAKLNLALAIRGTRPDGMHELDMLMQNISLADELSIKAADRLEVWSKNAAIGSHNTVKRAAKLFFQETGIKGGALIEIEKNIPLQSGLGGGSSDAAATLIALNDLFEAGLSMDKLRRMGVVIGADVPFFVGGGCMRARGIGEQLEKVRNRCAFHYLLIKPQKGVSTAEAYRRFDGAPQQRAADIDAAAKALEDGAPAEYFRAAGNALMPAGIELCPAVGEILRRCKDRGAEFAMMTGSGSCVFAVFAEEAAMERARQVFAAEYPFCATAEDNPFALTVL